MNYLGSEHFSLYIVIRQLIYLEVKMSLLLLSFISRESIVFGSNFRSEDFDGFTHFEVP